MYTQLTEPQRYQIYVLLKNDFTQKSIADEIGVHPSTISREIARNTGDRGYRPKQAHTQALERRHDSIKHKKMTSEMERLIIGYIKEDWSPEQISGYLKQSGSTWVSHETIYQFILQDKANSGDLYCHLRHSSKKRKKRYGSSDRRGEIKNRTSIDERPKHIEKRDRIGDWEIDTIIGQNHQRAIVTIVDRLSLMTLIAKVERNQASLVAHATIKLLRPYKNASHTITGDNGKEFSEHELISKKLEVDFYFAHPYSSWERGTNENTNGLIRQYIPKKTSFEKITDQDLEFITDRLNNRPRKCLGFRTPNQVFNEYLNYH